MMIFSLLAVVLLGVALVYFLNQRDQGQGQLFAPPPRRDQALDIVKRRYAQGEITKEEFERLRQDLIEQ